MSESRVVGFGDAPVARRRSRRGRLRAPDQWLIRSWWLLCAATLLAALALGALHRGSLSVVALLVFGSAGIVVSRSGWQSVPAPAWVLFGLAGYTALQAAPLPSGVVGWLSPHAAEVWQRAFDLRGKNGWMSLSLDRGATLVEVLKWAAYGAAFVSAASYGRRKGMLHGLLLPVAAPVAVGLVTLIHGLAGAQRIYGFYEPIVPRSIWHVGPLLNPNHLASYLNFGIFCALGLLAARRPVVPPWTLGLVIAFLMPNAIVAGSRGGIVGLVAGFLVFALMLPKETHADPDLGPVPRVTLVATMASVFVVAIGLTGLLATEQTAVQLYEVNIDKLRLWTWCRHLIADYPWFGVGRGAFESVFAAYRSGPSNEIYSHPENLPTQWLGEWGIPVSIAAAVGLARGLRPRRLGARWSVASSGAVAAMLAMLVQNFVDFGLEVPGIALTVVVALGVCWGHANGRRRGNSDANARGALAPFAVLGCVGAALVALVLAIGSRPLVLERRALADAYDAAEHPSKADLRSLRELALTSVMDHPAEPYFLRMGALLSWRLAENPMPWFTRALERGPAIGRTHLLLARYLAQKGALEQALLELRLAGTFDPNLVTATAHAALSWGQTYEGIIRAVPDGEAGVLALQLLSRETRARPALRERFLDELVARAPQRVSSLVALADFFLQQLEQPSSERCSVDRVTECLAQADHILNELERLAPRDPQLLLLRSRFLVVQGERTRALSLLRERCRTLPPDGQRRCLRERLNLAFAGGEVVEFGAAARDFVADSCGDSEQCGQSLERVADLSGRLGDWDAALGYYERAARERPDDKLWLKVARAGVRVAAFARVANALHHIRNSAEFEPEYSTLLRSAVSGRVGRTGAP